MTTTISRRPMTLAALAFTALAAVGCAQPAPAPMAANPPPPPPPAAPTDPQIAHIAYTAGVIDIKAAKLALQKSRNRQVRAFAQDMVRDHTAVNNKALALVKKLKVTPEDNDISRQLTAQADAEYARENGLSGAEFDRAYIANEVTYHNGVNGALSATLIPNAQNPELKALLQQGLKIFQGHQMHAEHLQGMMK